MKVFAVHPGPLMYSKVFLRLEPLGLELAAAAARARGHAVRLIDLQVESPRAFERQLVDWRPDLVAVSCNYLANVPEIVELAKLTKRLLPSCYVLIGGHSASFIAPAFLTHGGGAIDCVLKGEGEAGLPLLLDALAAGKDAVAAVPGAVTAAGEGPPPRLALSLDDLNPARDLLRHRRKYFLGILDPCASIELSRGCPWDCTFCSAWTFYGRSYRLRSPARIVEDLRSIAAPGVFIVDDVAFIQDQHGFAVGEAIAQAGIAKRYYLETRGDVLLRNKEVFRFWKRLGLAYIFLGLEALDEEGLRKYRKRLPLGRNFEALEFARSLGIHVAINLIADPDWDRERFAAVRRWCLEVPEVVNISVNTPYPGTESWLTETRRLQTRDYRLFDIQHCVLPTKLPLAEFYQELVETQQVLNRKHLGWQALRSTTALAGKLLLKGQTNFVKSLWKFNSVYDPALLLADHARPVDYAIDLPDSAGPPRDRRALYLHKTRGRADRAVDESTERFVDATRMGAAP
ncbi:MAG TPA: hopanoid C-3 methylase HpnR [Alphaproteobacteria bacterium]|nr:hopanoid C-3 methylase HpnR [Alphaproteobacteria bacterium]